MHPKISQINPSNWRFKNIAYGFTLQNSAPQHYFLDVFPLVWHLKDLKPMKKFFPKESFFIPNFVQKSDLEIDNLVYVYPTILKNKDKINFSIDCAYKEALEIFDKTIDANKDNYDLNLWLGLPSSDYRTWIEKIEGSALILKNLISYFPKIKVYIDGMTSYDRQRQDFPENKILYDKVVKATKETLEDTLVLDVNEFDGGDFKNTQSLIVFKSLAGYDYRTKICYCSMCDIAISEGNTTALVPFKFCKIPGVNFIPFTSWSERVGTKIIDFKIDSNIMQDFSSKDKPQGYKSYHIPPEHIYNLTAEVLEKLKNIKMHRLDVPPVELYAKIYEAEKNTQIKLNNNEATQSLLKNIKNQKMLLEIDNLILDKELKTLQIKQLQGNFVNLIAGENSAKARIQNHLAYKLGNAIIENSKSLFGYIRMFYVLSYIRDKHLREQKLYEEKIKTNPNLALPPLESYPDYNESLKEKECLTYKLGLAFIKGYKSWYKGGLIKFYFEAKALEREFKSKQAK